MPTNPMYTQDNLFEQVIVNGNEITDVDVSNSFNYMKKLDEQSKQIIEDYRAEIECENYEGDKWPMISYSIFNWLAARKFNKNFDYIPELLSCEQIKTKDTLNQLLKNQIDNAEILNNALHKFPETTKNITVYRGINNTIKKNIERHTTTKQVTFSTFMSTSLFLEVAKRFTDKNKKIIAITIPKGFPLPYIYPTLKYKDDNNVTIKETEVLIPYGATLKYINEYDKDGFTITNYELSTYVKTLRTNPYLNTLNKLLDTIWYTIHPKQLKRKTQNNSSRKNSKSPRKKGKTSKSILK